MEKRENLTIEYDVTLPDIEKMFHYVYAKTKAGKKQVRAKARNDAMIIGFFLVIFSLFLGGLILGFNLKGILISYGIGMGLAVGIYFLSMGSQAGKLEESASAKYEDEKYPIATGHQVLTLEEDWITKESAYDVRKLRYSVIDQVCRDGDFVYTFDAKGDFLHLIDGKAFKSPADYHAFFLTLAEKTGLDLSAILEAGVPLKQEG